MNEKMENTERHWEKVYQDSGLKSWWQEHSTISLQWISQYLDIEKQILDVGCGASVLVDNLLRYDYQNITLVEVSKTAIEKTKNRLKERAQKIIFKQTNILDFTTKQRFDLWHDRAVFHFLTEPEAQRIYLRKMDEHLTPEGYFLLATFSPEGPKKCSGLPIVAYDKAKIERALGANFRMLKSANENHQTPGGAVQNFNYFLFQKILP